MGSCLGSNEDSGVQVHWPKVLCFPLSLTFPSYTNEERESDYMGKRLLRSVLIVYFCRLVALVLFLFIIIEPVFILYLSQWHALGFCEWAALWLDAKASIPMPLSVSMVFSDSPD